MTDEQNPKKQSVYLKLKDSHPIREKFEKLIERAHELGIEISFGDCAYVTVKGFPHELMYVDAEDTDQGVGSFPPTFEYALRYRNPEHSDNKR